MTEPGTPFFKRLQERAFRRQRLLAEAVCEITFKACEATPAVDKKNAVDWITTWVNREQILTEMCMLHTYKHILLARPHGAFQSQGNGIWYKRREPAGLFVNCMR